jgi:hypothetical protein
MLAARQADMAKDSIWEDFPPLWLSDKKIDSSKWPPAGKRIVGVWRGVEVVI